MSGQFLTSEEASAEFLDTMERLWKVDRLICEAWLLPLLAAVRREAVAGCMHRNHAVNGVAKLLRTAAAAGIRKLDQEAEREACKDRYEWIAMGIVGYLESRGGLAARRE